ncbi:MAG: cupredoxin domain-containing protein [Chloroflexi bacterium]|nr:cupredoxin domain-containing protein [Chloroflexota bacterium]
MMKSRMRQIMVGFAGMALVLALAACGSSGGGGGATGQAAAAQGPVQEVKLSMGDFFYDPKEVTVKAGRVRFVLTNVGQTAHRFAVRGEGGFDQSSKNVGAGRESTFEIDLGPGTYKMGCTLGDHEKRGSVGKITVTQ